MIILPPKNNPPIPAMWTVKWWSCLHETHRWQNLWWQFTVCIKQFAAGHCLYDAEICRSTKHTLEAELGMFTWKKNENERWDKRNWSGRNKTARRRLGKNETTQQKCRWYKRELIPPWLMIHVKIRLSLKKINLVTTDLFTTKSPFYLYL